MVSQEKQNVILQLADKSCMPCRQGDAVLPLHDVNELLNVLPLWHLTENHSIQRLYKFSNFTETMKFVHLVADIAESNDHHPDVTFGYNYCSIIYTTHATNGLSENDFICAAQIELIATEK